VKKFSSLLLLIVLFVFLLVFSTGFTPAPQSENPLPVPDLQLGTIALAPIIVALVGLAKSLGMPTKYAPWLNGALALVGYGLIVVVQLVPAALDPTTYLLNAVIIFLSAAGFYDRTQKILRGASGG
jgi:peptidoglycan/LPS O-acetylase OafA/YrhL